MEWIIKPNRWYDNREEPIRFYMLLWVFLLIVTLPSVVLGDVGFQAGMFILALIGIYRIAYHTILNFRHFKMSYNG